MDLLQSLSFGQDQWLLITDMNSMFFNCTNFNQDISTWDTSNVTNMSQMFNAAKAFNQDITDWNVSKVTNFSDMFNYAHAFNADVSKWRISNVGTPVNMTRIFRNSGNVEVTGGAFNKDISRWDMTDVNNTSGMFQGNIVFTNGESH